MMAQDPRQFEAQKIRGWRTIYYFIQGSYYFFQGFSNAGIATYIQVTMANWDVPVDTQATIFAIAGIPLYLKMFIGLLTDRVPISRWGRRRPYILMGMALYLPAIALLLSIQHFSGLWVLSVFLLPTAWMLVDTTTDALAVELTPRDLTARMQGVSFGSISAGLAIGFLLTPLLGEGIGWTPTIAALILIVLAGSGITLMYPDTPISREARSQQQPSGQVLKGTFVSPAIWLTILFFLFYEASSGYGNLINVYLLTVLGWAGQAETVRAFGLVSALGFLSRVVGVLLVWRLPTRWQGSIWLYAVALAVFWLCTLPWVLVHQSPDNVTLIFASMGLFGAAIGFKSSLASSLAMRFSRRSLEAFSFATYMAALNLGVHRWGPRR